MLKSLYAWARGIFHRIFTTELMRRVVKNTGYLSSAAGISFVLSFLGGILAARLVGVEGRGIVGVVVQFSTMVNSVTSFRMSELVVKYVGHFSEQDDQTRAAAVFKGAALVEMLTSFISIALLWPLTYWLIAPQGVQLFLGDIESPEKVTWVLFYGTGLIFINMAIESTTGLLQIFNCFRQIAVINVLQSITVITVTVSALILGGDVFTLLMAYLGSKLVGAVGKSAIALREANKTWGRGWWRTPLSVLRGHIRELAVFGISTNLSGTLSFIVQNSESLWISAFRPTEEAGYYSIAKTVANIVLMPIMPLPKATYPEMARQVARRSWSNLRSVLRQGSLLAGIYTLASSVGLVLFGKFIISIYGVEFLPAYPALMIMLVGLLVANTFYWARPALLSLGLPDYATKVNLGVTILNIIGALILIPQIGYLGSAVMLTISYLFGITLSVLKARSELRRLEAMDGGA